GEEEEGDLRGLADAEPDDQQHEIGQLRQRSQKLDERRRQCVDRSEVPHGEAEQRAEQRAAPEAGEDADEAVDDVLPERPALVTFVEEIEEGGPQLVGAGEEEVADDAAPAEADPGGDQHGGAERGGDELAPRHQLRPRQWMSLVSISTRARLSAMPKSPR